MENLLISEQPIMSVTQATKGKFRKLGSKTQLID